VDDVLSVRVGGLAMGRNIFQAADAARLARLVADRVHAEPAPAPPPRELTTAVQ
jgi:DhnA family fructose-bisphosphate aldolase class Ia